jgi:8-oxo-dGTP pyrophosphatase MutT (NUDIX family)
MSKTKNELRHIFAQGPRTDLSETFSKASGVALLFCGEGSELELLFIKRAVNPKDNWSGQLAFPGGKRDDADDTLLDTCLREVHEELGLILPRPALIGSLDDLQARQRGNLLEFFIQPFVFYLDRKPDLIPCSSEVAEVLWVRLDYLRSEKNQAEYIFERDGVSMNLPGIRFASGDTLWGLTYLMVSNLFKKLGHF